MKLAIILNAKRTTEALLNQLNDNKLTEKYNLTYDLFIKDPAEIVSFLKNLNPQSYNAYIVGGGDGTVRMVAQHLMGYSTS